MVNSLVKLLIKLVRWLDPSIVIVPAFPKAILQYATARILHYEARQAHRSGEWKRDQVYKELHRAFPKEPSRSFGLAIEYAIHRVKPWT